MGVITWEGLWGLPGRLGASGELLASLPAHNGAAQLEPDFSRSLELPLGYPGNARAPGPCTLPASGPRCFSSCSFYPSPFRASISPPWLVLGAFSPSSRSCHLLRNSEGPVPVGTRHPISMVTCRNLGMPGAWSPWMWPLPTGGPAGEVMRGGREEVQHLLGQNVDRGIHSCALPHSGFLPKAHR